MKKLVFSLLILLTFAGCSKNTVPKEPKPTPVHVAYARLKDVPYYLSTVGHMEAYEVVHLMAQVDGQLMKTYFADGADVKQGDLLYLIDQRPYLANLEKAKGQLEENLAQLQLAQQTAKRNSQLVKDEYISQNDYDHLMTNVTTGEATVKQSRATLDNAKIDLGYTTIYSPLDARAGESQVRDGNLILGNSETTLVTLNKITPIYSVFYINEKDLQEVQRCHKERGNLKVHVNVEDVHTSTYEGQLTFIDNGIDLSTGMIKLKGTHPNEDQALWPNQYVKVKLILDTIEDAVVVPAEAVQTSPHGKYLYIVRGNKTIEQRNITVGQMQDDHTIVVTKGLKEGERVVTIGQLSLYPGAKVAIVETEENR